MTRRSPTVRPGAGGRRQPAHGQRQGGPRTTTAARSSTGRATLLARHCERVFVSVRADQQDDPCGGPAADRRRARRRRPDRRHRRGAGGAPGGAWLVLACDLPFLDDAAIGHLVAARDGRAVGRLRSSHDGLPEPLCAIYEPASRAGVLDGHRRRAATARASSSSARGVALLEQPDPAALDNVNTPEELQRARGSPGRAGDAMKTITLQYFAVLREQAGRSEETPRDGRRDAGRAVRGSCAARHGFTLPLSMLRVAVNEEFCDWSRPLADGRPRRVHSARRGRLMQPFAFSTAPIDPDRGREALARPGLRRLRERSKAGCATTTRAARCGASSTRPSRRSPNAKANASSPRRSRASACSTPRACTASATSRIGEMAVWVGVSSRAPRRGLRGLPLHHRRGEAPRADLEEGALRRRRLGLGELRALRAAAVEHDSHAITPRRTHGTRDHGTSMRRACRDGASHAARTTRARSALPEVGAAGQQRLRAGVGARRSAPAASACRCCSTSPPPASAASASSTATSSRRATCTGSRSTASRTSAGRRRPWPRRGCAH